MSPDLYHYLDEKCTKCKLFIEISMSILHSGPDTLYEYQK